VTLGLLTFVQEDVPTVSGALLAAAGSLPWHVGFLGVFLGIWTGDALLYLVARVMGRPLMRYAWTKRFFDPLPSHEANNGSPAKERGCFSAGGSFRNASPDVPGRGFPPPSLRTISAANRSGGRALDGRHLFAGQNAWSGTCFGGCGNGARVAGLSC
jgi:hypothetical protein